MRQFVTVHRYADRHVEPHEREFAESHQVAMPAGKPLDVATAALRFLDLPEGKYAITIDWPCE